MKNLYCVIHTVCMTRTVCQGCTASLRCFDHTMFIGLRILDDLNELKLARFQNTLIDEISFANGENWGEG